MQGIDIVRQVDVVRTPRLMQLEGLFDIPPSEKSQEKWRVDIDLPKNWNVGLIVGPSGSGKSTVARELFGAHLANEINWPENKSIVDGFPPGVSIKDIVDALSSVGFSSPPSWVRPFHALSNGEQFRANMARVLVGDQEISVVDEFTSVVDRNVAMIGSAAIQKAVRRRGKKFIAVSCHYDIAEWLEPDWIYEPHINRFTAGRLLQRPKIELNIRRVDSDAWAIFRKHHYLDTSLNKAAQCFIAFWRGAPVAFASVLHFPHPSSARIKREHRTVTLPDFQGVGIGNALSDYIASVYLSAGFRYLSITSHPAMMRSRGKSKNWKMTACPNAKTKAFSVIGAGGKDKMALRFRASFEYIGQKADQDDLALLA